MRNVSLAFALSIMATVMAGPSRATCVKPDIPACAVQNGAFSGAADFDQCRKQMLAYKDGMESLASCLKEASQTQEAKSAQDELETGLSQFNRRARGEAAN